MKHLVVFLLAFIAGTGCALFRSVEKDPAAAVATAKADARKAKAETAAACKDLRAAEAAGLIPAGKVKDDLDLFCELDATIP